MTARTYPMRCSVRASAGGVTTVQVYDDIGPGGFFADGLTAKSFAASLADVTGPLDVRINSGGGDVADGIAIYNAIRSYQGRKRTVVDGMAASIASVILQAGDERVVQPGATVMIHDPLTALMGNEADFLKAAEVLGKHGDNLAALYAKRAGGTPEQWRDVMRGERWYTADEAVSDGLADRVGDEDAVLPAGLDLAAYQSIPGRIAARLMSLPVRAAYAADGDDGGAPASPKGISSGKCKTCKGKGRLSHPVRGSSGPMCPSCEGTGVYPPGGSDPDGDGDDDSSAAGDTDHDYVLPDGSPGPKALTEERVRAILREEVARIAAAGADDSPWDGPKAMANGAASDDPAKFYAGICAGRREGDPANQGSWALPYRYRPDDPPNAAGVKAALSRLPQVQGLVNEAEARKTLQAAMKQVNPDYEPEDGTTASASGWSPEAIRSALRGANA